MQTLIDSLLISLFGIVAVFLVLSLMILMIYLLAAAARVIAKPPAMPAALPEALPETEAAPGRAPAVSPADPFSLKLIDVDEKTAALIMAIVCDEIGAPPGELYFKSVRLLQDQAPVPDKGV